MKIEIMYDNQGMICVVYPGGETEFKECEYELPERLLRLLDGIPYYSKTHEREGV